MKKMKLRYAGKCLECGASLPARSEAIYESETKTVRCLDCGDSVGEPTVQESESSVGLALAEPGIAGSSARREYKRRKARDEERLRERWGRFGALAVALSEERQSTKAWERGAVGEERLGARLDSLVENGIAVFHDRGIPGSKANIDHIAITPGRIWVIDAKRYKGRPELKVEGGLFRPRVEKLLVGRRDCTKLVDGVLKQVEVVRKLVPDVSVVGALCFVEADWPLIGAFFSTRGVQVLSPRRLAKRLTGESVGDVSVAEVQAVVASRFRPA
jgi:DNA-directed RNA polymerase subunit RPC12/RpoP